jgi:TatD DNase family protein
MSFRYIDTHAHLNLALFDADVEAVTERCQVEEVAVINVGTKESTSARAVELAKQNEQQYAIIGLHPIQAASSHSDTAETEEGDTFPNQPGEVFEADFYRQLAKSNRVIGVGECGLDYYHTLPASYELQEAAFIAQIELANELNLPLMIHTRGPKQGKVSPTGRSVYKDVYEILKQYARVPFNVHFYAGTYDEAKQFFSLGGTISFTGVITFAKVYEEIIKVVPLELIHAETDCPYVAPVPYRGQRAEPWMVQSVYNKIAEVRDIPEEEVREVLVNNARRFYNLFT